MRINPGSALTLLVAFALVIISAVPTLAAPVLTANMNYRDVLSVRGPAAEKHEMESKREQLWIYPDGTRLRFREGRLISGPGLEASAHSLPGASPVSAAAAKSLQLPSVITAQPASPRHSSRVAGLLRDIMKTIPSTDEAAAPSPGTPGRQPQMRTPPHAPVKMIEQPEDFDDREEE